MATSNRLNRSPIPSDSGMISWISNWGFFEVEVEGFFKKLANVLIEHHSSTHTLFPQVKRHDGGALSNCVFRMNALRDFASAEFQTDQMLDVDYSTRASDK